MFQLDVKTLTNNTITLNAIQYLVMTHEYNAISSWASINSVMLITQTLPIRKEYFPIRNSGIASSTGVGRCYPVLP